MKGDKKTGVLLLNLGGPDSLSAVRPFLYNLFSDREIIRLGPPVLQKPLAYLISTLRHKKTESYYRLIGSKSPILEITKAQAAALEAQLKDTIPVYVGMRYWRPLIEDVLKDMLEDGISRIIALGLYPHYSVATTGSSFSMLRRSSEGRPIEIFEIGSWYDHPLYIDALVETIREGLALFRGNLAPSDGSDVTVLFSAHSLPKKFIEEGDPYADQIKGTINKVLEKIDIRWELSFQSKSGPVEWLEPSTEEMIEKLATKGIKNVLAVPISFVSDHIETLYEIDILYKMLAASRGMRLERSASLNTSPLFISALADIVRKGIKDAGWA